MAGGSPKGLAITKILLLKALHKNHQKMTLLKGEKGGRATREQAKGRFANWRPANSRVATHLEEEGTLSSAREKQFPNLSP